MELSEKFITTIATKAREIAGIDKNKINLDAAQLLSGLDFKIETDMSLDGYRLSETETGPTIEISQPIEKADKSIIAILIGQHFIQKIIESENGIPQSTDNPSISVMDLCVEFAQNLTMPKDNFTAIAKEFYDERSNSYNLDEIADALGIDMVDVYDRGVQLGLFAFGEI